MQTRWLLDVLADLTRYAEDNDLEELARHLAEARHSVPENEDDDSKLAKDLSGLKIRTAGQVH